MIPAVGISGGRVSSSETTAYFWMSEVRVQFWGKVAPAGCTRPIFPARQGENDRRPISSARFSLGKSVHPALSQNDHSCPCCVASPFFSIDIPDSS